MLKRGAKRDSSFHNNYINYYVDLYNKFLRRGISDYKNKQLN